MACRSGLGLSGFQFGDWVWNTNNPQKGDRSEGFYLNIFNIYIEIDRYVIYIERERVRENTIWGPWGPGPSKSSKNK